MGRPVLESDFPSPVTRRDRRESGVWSVSGWLPTRREGAPGCAGDVTLSIDWVHSEPTAGRFAEEMGFLLPGAGCACPLVWRGIKILRGGVVL